MQINFDEEIELKRLDTSYLIKFLATKFECLIKLNNFSGYGIQIYRKAYKHWKSNIKKNATGLNEFNKKLNNYNHIIDLLINKIDQNKDISKELLKFNKIKESITIFDFNCIDFPTRKLEEILYHREILSFKYKIHLKYFIYTSIFTLIIFVIKAIIFFVPFYISSKLNCFQNQIIIKNFLYSNLAIALTFFLLIDQFIMKEFEKKNQMDANKADVR